MDGKLGAIVEPTYMAIEACYGRIVVDRMCTVGCACRTAYRELQSGGQGVGGLGQKGHSACDCVNAVQGLDARYDAPDPSVPLLIHDSQSYSDSVLDDRRAGCGVYGVIVKVAQPSHD